MIPPLPRAGVSLCQAPFHPLLIPFKGLEFILCPIPPHLSLPHLASRALAGPDPPGGVDTLYLSCPPTHARPLPPGTLLLRLGDANW